jgi:predicted RNase H-like HicB family nuclease
MAVHDEVLEAAQRVCARRDPAVFTPDEIVRALPHLNPQTVRTHVTSRCCVNARPHHQTRLAYFRRVERGRYELLEAFRQTPVSRRPPARRRGAVARPGHDTIHAVVSRDGATYVVSCLEVAVVTQGRTLDECLVNLTEALSLHLEDEDLDSLGLAGVRRVHVSYDFPVDVTAA